MEYIELYILVFIVLVVVITLLIFLNKKNKKRFINTDELIKLFNKEDIVNIDYVRNKIVVSFKDVTKFNLESLHGTYAKGITVVGDKIKFYVSDEPKVNEDVFNSIKTFIGR